ncbi:MAG: hypothetical protein WCH46_00155 [bacterium]
MQKIKQFIFLVLVLISSICANNSFAQPSLKWITDYTAPGDGLDSGLFRCITHAVPTDYACTICDPHSFTYPYKYWIHLRNNVGQDMLGEEIYKIEITFKSGGGNYYSFCRPCKNWGQFHAGGYPQGWLMSLDGNPVDTPSYCAHLGGGIADHVMTFTPPADSLKIQTGNHWMLTFYTNNNWWMKVYFKKPDGSGLRDLTIQGDSDAIDDACEDW